MRIDNRDFLDAWTAVITFIVLFFLDGSLFKSGLIAVFVYISCRIDFGRRWLIPAGFALSILGIAVALGFPHPSQWWDQAKAISLMVKSSS